MPSFLRTLGIGAPSKRLIGERIRSKTARVNSNPLFVFGNQKSGTTAIAALLAAATGKSVILDFAGATGQHARQLIQKEISVEKFSRRNAWAFSHEIIKEPNLTFAAPELMAYFGTRQAIFIVRDPRENLRSMLQRLKLRGDQNELSAAQLRRLNPTWRNILTGVDLGLSRDHYVSVLAKRWVRALEIFAQLKEQLVLIRYEDFNSNKIETIQFLAHAFGFIVTNDISSLLDRAYQPRAAVPTNLLEFFGRDNLARINEICAGQILNFRYTPY